VWAIISLTDSSEESLACLIVFDDTLERRMAKMTSEGAGKDESDILCFSRKKRKVKKDMGDGRR
jgi:hypothetical protein